MLLEKESHVLEKLKLLSVAFDYAEKKGQILDSNLYHGPTLNCPPDKDAVKFMETFHALDAFVYGTCMEDSLLWCGPANHWTIQIGKGFKGIQRTNGIKGRGFLGLRLKDFSNLDESE